ncbi:class II glutamine amidotransferase [Niveibacterium microcysteis]|uniref:Class II glutamine amidotransferase n=1 Tax=Niveibacterium microcysteis TaxID=2811415 RepID=A0ABX7M7I9_9RHOO|nr:class II glutamine amidotransferase [Niveibacterium microcysteis]QSI76609.1 class II glutamine amidotransferase [Niveibacterium microcysteis]
MCQLLGVSARKPVSAAFALQGFLLRGGETDQHADGWGIGYYQGEHARMLREARAAAHSGLALRIREQQIRSRNFIVHVRKATRGGIAERNCHPFRRELWGRSWLFAHNGDLGSALPWAHGLFQPIGETDSERAFCLLLNQLVDRFGLRRPPDDVLDAAISAAADRLAQHGSFNFLLSDGNRLYARCATQLFHVERRYPFAQVELIDCGQQIDLARHNHLDDRISVIATQPLTRGETWHAFAPGETKIFVRGAEQTTQAAATPRPLIYA